MVFSLFRKPQEKMPERPVARPKAPAAPPPGNRGEPAEASQPDAARSPLQPPVPATAPGPEDPQFLDFTDSQFGDTAFLAIEVEQGGDALQADIEQAAVLFANGQDSAARAVLEMCARSHTGSDAERLWRMLLDLMQVLGDRAAFEQLGMEFTEACETSAPTWRESEKAMPAADVGEKILVVQGIVSGADAAQVIELKKALAAKEPVRVDFGKVIRWDNEAAGALCDILRLARKQGVPVTLEGADDLVRRLEEHLVVGQPQSPGTWLFLLELYQRLGRVETFEDRAVDYAVTFEVSPPSWEDVKAPPKGSKAPETSAAPQEKAMFLSGELKNYRFGELPNYLDSTDQPILDFSQVKRVDFFSAGLLRNTLEPYRRKGKEVVIRHPHHLVAELMGIVGLNHVAQIIVPKS